MNGGKIRREGRLDDGESVSELHQGATNLADPIVRLPGRLRLRRCQCLC